MVKLAIVCVCVCVRSLACEKGSFFLMYKKICCSLELKVIIFT